MGTSIIACRTASYAPFDSIAHEHLAALGIRNVEIPVPAAGAIETAKAELDRWGLTATTLHGKCDVARADLAAAIEAQMPAFAAFGTKLMFVSVKAGDTPLETVYARLREAGDAAAAHGVTIVMETHPDMATNGEVAARTMQAVRHSSVRINYDTANVHFYNKSIDEVAELRKCVQFVSAMHLKDTDGGYRSWHFPALGRGVVNFGEIFRTLDEAGFDGPCTLEIEGIEGEARTKRMVCDRIAESLGYLRGVGRI